MKNFTLVLSMCLFLAFTSEAQKKVRESDLRGQWKMVFDFDEEDLEDEIEDSFWLGTIVSGPLSGFVKDILDDIEIQMEFLDGGKLKITVEAYGDEDVEYEEWYITSAGELVLGDGDDDDDEVWLLEGNKLYQYDKKSQGRLERQEVFLVRK